MEKVLIQNGFDPVSNVNEKYKVENGKLIVETKMRGQRYYTHYITTYKLPVVIVKSGYRYDEIIPKTAISVDVNGNEKTVSAIDFAMCEMAKQIGFIQL